MKLLLISASDREGGAHIAAFRMAEAMNESGIETKLLVLSNITTKEFVIPIRGNSKAYKLFIDPLHQRFLSRVRSCLFRPNKMVSFGSASLIKRKNLSIIENYDAIYIHWVQNHFISISDIAWISERKPVFIYVNDMWYFTGGCHYSFECENWKSGCSNCPIIKRFTILNIPHKICCRKRNKWLNNNITIITSSNWLADCAKHSYTLNDFSIHVIPNTLNIKTFCVLDKRKTRQLMGLPLDRKLVLFGAYGGTGNKTKGWPFAHEAMKKLGAEADLVVLGNDQKIEDYTTHSIGRISDESSLALLYNAVDVFISPALAEAFGQTIAESISCGTKAVVFNVGGTPDIVDHLDNGYLAELRNTEDLVRGIRWALQSDNSPEERKRLHRGIELKFSYEVVSRKHLSLINLSVNGLG